MLDLLLLMIICVQSLSQVPGACFSLVDPTPVKNPITVACSQSALSLIDLPEEQSQRKDFAEYFSGNKLLPGSKTAAHCYCGHQFGYFSGQLGDGAAMLVHFLDFWLAEYLLRYISELPVM